MDVVQSKTYVRFHCMILNSVYGIPWLCGLIIFEDTTGSGRYVEQMFHQFVEQLIDDE
jgi:hypothetical protein